MQDFLGGNHPPSWDGRNTTYMWVRANNTARSILNIRDASCGMWIRLPEGDFAGFSGEQSKHQRRSLLLLFVYPLSTNEALAVPASIKAGVCARGGGAYPDLNCAGNMWQGAMAQGVQICLSK
jgi:hypothetical protein